MDEQHLAVLHRIRGRSQQGSWQVASRHVDHKKSLQTHPPMLWSKPPRHVLQNGGSVLLLLGLNFGRVASRIV